MDQEATEHVIARTERASLAGELRKLTRAGRMVVAVTIEPDAWRVVTVEAPRHETRGAK